ncbi:YlbF family regulator [Heyndrickxia coagulans]|uniref:UPF0342 protein SAMN02745208_00541 n=1 Tax=Heyndrickxia coagulans DSM 1 = ATCC 7050 TaxID=1121088 RepID=A0A8B4BQC1_HEYCO|nr:YlbF family regulator [Heyndrickxia coagulans]AJH78618.1 hypothetical protein BF29_3283 [Heyndrickxia coagulans DSM 1 = ATCC 7050]MCR2845612.1 YlbF family regulator [Heyndrickxia coagulans]MDR4223521.1 hypothetical protein [Heyndrickxia coagulans DSM 1 = ATCC 7050]MED4494250.1 YlbF family regulator [Heyndrickxia coagulans]MED4535905.1 YlbF family regulator [Heyndrickxia coagulans]
MPSHLNEYARMLEKGIRESHEFAALKQAYENVRSNGQARALFDRFRQLQLNLQDKQMQGLPVTEEDEKQAQAAMQAVQANPAIMQLIGAEQRLSDMLSEINQVLMKPVEDLYNGK